MSANDNTTDTGSTTVSYSSAAGGADGSTSTPTPTTTATTEATSVAAPVSIGSRTGQVRMFNRFRGYGFITVHGEDNLDVFVHQTNVCPSRSTFRYLSVGEYVSLDISDDDKRQALNVRGINGGPLQCDAPRRRRPRPTNSNTTDGGDEQGEFQVVERRNRRQGGGRGRGGRGRGGRGHGSRADGESVGRSGQGVNLSEFIPSPATTDNADNSTTAETNTSE